MANSLGKARSNQASEQYNVSNPNNQQSTTELPAKDDQFHIVAPNDLDIEDDQQVKAWLHKAHNATETMREHIGGVLKAKRESLHSQGKASGGGWQQWVKDNCDFTVRTANRYIKAHDINDKGLPPEGEGKDEGKPIQARVEFSDKELGSFYKKAKGAKKVKRRLNEKFEQAARDVRDELQKEAEDNGLDLDEHILNKRNEKDEEDLKDVTSDSGQSQE